MDRLPILRIGQVAGVRSALSRTRREMASGDREWLHAVLVKERPPAVFQNGGPDHGLGLQCGWQYLCSRKTALLVSSARASGEYQPGFGARWETLRRTGTAGTKFREDLGACHVSAELLR